MPNPKSCLLIFTLLLSSFGLNAQTSANPCLEVHSFRVVVIGSSTAAGSGASVSDSAWVNRYRDFLTSLNPDNEVINIAMGGYNTYRLMPSWFVPPVNRPDPDTARNVTKALSFNPDAIIINLPSNDASAGWGVVEQMGNFIAMVDEAQLQNVPVWVCTTQPRNFGSSNQVQIQLDVRDSIVAQFSPNVLDFWTGLASQTNQMGSAYDSGDGVHLNDAGHGLLFNRVVTANIPGALLDSMTFSGPEWVAKSLMPVFPNVCGDSAQVHELVIANVGAPSTNDVPLVVEAHQNGSVLQTWNDTIFGGLAACTTDTLSYTVNTWNGGAFDWTAYVVVTDTNAANDTVEHSGVYSGHPSLSAMNDTVCTGDSLWLQALANAGDTVFWYDSLVGGAIIGSGSGLSLPPSAGVTQRYAQAVRGSVFYEESLTTTWTSNINWNGCMFDLVASDSIVIDSLSLKVASLGQQNVELYYRNGSYTGFESSSGAWTFGGTETVTVTNANDPVTISPVTLTLLPGDTIGIYLQLANAGSNLSYRSQGAAQSWSDNQLEIVTGAGISHNFSGTFSPRNWNGEVFYHHGFNPTGDCATDRIPVTGVSGQPAVNLGNDSSICPGVNVTLDAGPGLHYQWSTGDSSQTISTGMSGTYQVTVTDPVAGCSAADTVNLTDIAPPVDSLPEVVVDCGGPVTLDAGNPGLAYVWNDQSNSQMLSATATGVYVVSITNACTTVVDSSEVVIQSLPVVNLAPQYRNCDTVVISLTPEPYTQYQWSGGDTGTTKSFTASGPALVSAMNSCGTAFDVTDVIVDEPLVASFIPTIIPGPGMVNVYAVGISGNSSVNWDFGDGNTASDPYWNHTYDSSGTYLITLVVGNTCGTDTSTQSVDILIVGGTTISVQEEWGLYPNPSRGEVWINRPEQMNGNLQLDLMDATGRLVSSEILQPEQQRILLEEQPVGIYFFQLLLDGNPVHSGKLILESQ